MNLCIQSLTSLHVSLLVLLLTSLSQVEHSIYFIMPIVLCHAAIPTTSTSEVTSFQVTAAITGGAMGGALFLVIVLLVLVVIIAVVVMNRKKAAVQSFQLEVLAR